MWNQVRDANWKVPYTGGWCLEYVQDAFGTDHPYASAIDAWNANYGGGNHPGELPPAGKTVPVYFSLGNVPAGHVAIYLDDAEVASSTQAGTHPEGYIHPTLQNLIDVYGKYNGGCTYLGWSEYVGTVHVLSYQPAVVYATADQITQAYQDILKRAPDAAGLAHYEGYTIDFVRQDLLNSQEHKDLVAAEAAQTVTPQQSPAVAPPLEPTTPAPTTTTTPTPEPTTTAPTPEPTTTAPAVPAATVSAPVLPSILKPLILFIKWLLHIK